MRRTERRAGIDLVAADNLDDGQHIHRGNQARREGERGHQEGRNAPAKRPVPCREDMIHAS